MAPPARKPSSTQPSSTQPSSTQPGLQTNRAPSATAVETMAKLAAAGASPSRMIGAVNDVLIEWSAEGTDPSDLRERIELLQADIDAGYEAAQEYAGEAETPAAAKAAQAQATALKAVQHRLAEVIAAEREAPPATDPSQPEP